jgi:hypothetical protein
MARLLAGLLDYGLKLKTEGKILMLEAHVFTVWYICLKTESAAT